MQKLQPSGGSKSRAIVARALLRVAVPSAIGTGVILFVVGLVDRQHTTLLISMVTLAIGLWAEMQRRRDRPQPLLMLSVASLGLSMAAFLGDRTAAVSVLPAFSLFMLVGIFTLARPTAKRFGVWCGVLALACATRLFPDPTASELVSVTVQLATTWIAGFWLLARAGDALLAEEEALTSALESKQELLAFEQAIATCSQALLGSGKDPVPVALDSLRSAIGADAAYLVLNVEDPELGPSFRIVNSSIDLSAGSGREIGAVIPWSAWLEPYGQLSRGEPYKYVDREGIARMGVPIFNDGSWIGALGLQGQGHGEWPEDPIKLLLVAAPMLATYWEREVTRQRLEELVRSKDRFLASISHEIRTPLAAVLGFSEELISRSAVYTPEERTEILELIAQQSQDMADMVEDLLVGARADMGTISVQPEVVYLRSQAEAALFALRSTHGKRLQVVGGPGKAWADPSRTRQIIRNLISNAIRYGGDEITIEADTSKSETIVRVRDNGPALPSSDWERIFEPYQRAHDRPTQPGSIGLGLTVSRQLARLMSGDLVYRSDGSESMFELTVPSEPVDPDRSPLRPLATVAHGAKPGSS